jgi:hypothetical protein
MNVTLGQSICDAIAHNVDGLSNDIRGFDWFHLDMTQSYFKRWNDNGRVERVAVMQRQAGQKTSERMLWTVGPVSKDKAESLVKIEREAELSRLQLAYANNPNFELDCEPMTLAIGLAKAYRHHTGELPSFLLDDNGEL